MTVNSKRKGSFYERVISNKLSKKFVGYTGIETSFRRNQDSGSFFGGSNRQRTTTHDLDKATFGDIVCPKNFKYTIECKNYKTAPSLASIIKEKVSQIDKWITQAESDAVSSNKDFLLIIKYNNVDDFVIVSNNIGKIFTQILPKILYKQYMWYTLDAVLSMDDSMFFTN